jgi:hypothetical protein
MTHGITNTARLYYLPTNSGLNGVVSTVGGTNFDGISAFARIPLEDFDRHYRVLQTEPPLSLAYYCDSSDSTIKPVTLVSTESGTELPGEGPEDVDVPTEGGDMASLADPS